jgi:hypothetical protein
MKKVPGNSINSNWINHDDINRGFDHIPWGYNNKSELIMTSPGRIARDGNISGTLW